MTADEQRDALELYCHQHRCKTCPVNTAELGCLRPDDMCVVSLALNEIEKREATS